MAFSEFKLCQYWAAWLICILVQNYSIYTDNLSSGPAGLDDSDTAESTTEAKVTAWFISLLLIT